MHVGSSLNIYRTWQIGGKKKKRGGRGGKRAEKSFEMSLSGSPSETRDLPCAYLQPEKETRLWWGEESFPLAQTWAGAAVALGMISMRIICSSPPWGEILVLSIPKGQLKQEKLKKIKVIFWMLVIQLGDVWVYEILELFSFSVLYALLKWVTCLACMLPFSFPKRFSFFFFPPMHDGPGDASIFFFHLAFYSPLY